MQSDPEVQLQVDRGPDWLFIRLNSGLHGSRASSSVADRVWDQLERHFIFRLVLEVDDLEQLDGEMVRQLLKLKDRVDDRGGTLRLCALRYADPQAVHKELPSYSDRHSAVLGSAGTLCGPK